MVAAWQIRAALKGVIAGLAAGLPVSVLPPAFNSSRFEFAEWQTAAVGSVVAAGVGLLVARYTGQRDCAAFRSRSRLCLRCGYSLAGNLSGVCPECGAPVSPPTTTKGAAWPG